MRKQERVEHCNFLFSRDYIVHFLLFVALHSRSTSNTHTHTLRLHTYCKLLAFRAPLQNKQYTLQYALCKCNAKFYNIVSKDFAWEHWMHCETVSKDLNSAERNNKKKKTENGKLCNAVIIGTASSLGVYGMCCYAALPRPDHRFHATVHTRFKGRVIVVRWICIESVETLGMNYLYPVQPRMSKSSRWHATNTMLGIISITSKCVRAICSFSEMISSNPAYCIIFEFPFSLYSFPLFRHHEPVDWQWTMYFIFFVRFSFFYCSSPTHLLSFTNDGSAFTELYPKSKHNHFYDNVFR